MAARNYRAERERRNALAREYGFTSHDQVTRYLRKERGRTLSPSYIPPKAGTKARDGHRLTAAEIAGTHRESFTGRYSFRTIGPRVMGLPQARKWWVNIQQLYTNNQYDDKYRMLF